MSITRLISLSAAIVLLSACATTASEISESPVAPEAEQLLTSSNATEPSAPASNADTATIDLTSVVAQAAVQATADDPVICRRIQRTGTHFRREVCNRESEIVAAREEAQRLLRQSSGAVRNDRQEQQEQALTGF